MPRFSRKTPYVTGVVFALLGLVLLIGGVWLVALGGSFYYLIAGLGVAVTGGLLIAGRLEALWLYALIVLGTTVWAVAEVGLVGWQLEPRLLAPVVLALWLILPWITRKLRRQDVSEPQRWTRAAAAPGIAALVAIVVLAIGFAQPVGVSGAWAGNRIASPEPGLVGDGDWQYYGRTPRGDRFSPLARSPPPTSAG